MATKLRSNPVYQLTDEKNIINDLQTILSSISDRLDALEGVRGYGQVTNRLDILDSDANRLHGFTNETTPKA